MFLYLLDLLVMWDGFCIRYAVLVQQCKYELVFGETGPFLLCFVLILFVTITTKAFGVAPQLFDLPLYSDTLGPLRMQANSINKQIALQYQLDSSQRH